VADRHHQYNESAVFDRGDPVVTDQPAANFDSGDADNRSLFITASTLLYRIRVGVPGR
jgi:hypothetical protein